jgi:hypothetical protein
VQKSRLCLYLSSPGQPAPTAPTRDREPEPRAAYTAIVHFPSHAEKMPDVRGSVDGLAPAACAPARVQMGISLFFFFFSSITSTFEAQAQASIPFFPTLYRIPHAVPYKRAPSEVVRRFRVSSVHTPPWGRFYEIQLFVTCTVLFVIKWDFVTGLGLLLERT